MPENALSANQAAARGQGYLVQMSGIVFVVGKTVKIPSPGPPVSDGYVLHIHQVAGLEPSPDMPTLDHHPAFDIQPHWGDPRVLALSSSQAAFVKPMPSDR